MCLGGAGGKGVWGKLGSELLEEDLDKNDPNYDSDSLDNGDIELATVLAESSDEELRVNTFQAFLSFSLSPVVQSREHLTNLDLPMAFSLKTFMW
jgi:hypothetical protein